jgi:hypothetical protein
VKQRIARIPRRELRRLPKTAKEIEAWILSIGGKPMDRKTERQLRASGNWGMPEE